ncbi:MAG: hypothetical protein H6829_07350 [Planctomycetes bacterium]|nr:hypothetical protein [Planctomycetota bacterium]
MYHRTSSGWQIAQLLTDPEGALGHFGESVAIEGNVLVVAQPYYGYVPGVTGPIGRLVVFDGWVGGGSFTVLARLAHTVEHFAVRPSLGLR